MGGIPACLAARWVLSQHALQQGGACSRGSAPRGPAAGDGGVENPRKQTATVEDGTHPTGMHSCFTLWLLK